MEKEIMSIENLGMDDFITEISQIVEKDEDFLDEDLREKDKSEDNYEKEDSEKNEESETENEILKEEKETIDYEEEHEDEEEGQPQELLENKFSILAEALSENGVLNFVSEEEIKKVKSFQDLSDLIREEIRRSEFSNLTEKQKEFLKAISEGVDEEEYLGLSKKLNEIEKIKVDDLVNSQDLRVEIIVKDLVEQGVSESKARKIAEKSVDLGEDLEDAKEALRSIKSRIEEAKKELIKKAEEENRERQKRIEENINKIKKTLFEEKKPIIEGLPYNQEISKKVFKNLTEPAKIENGKPVSKMFLEREKDPIGFDIKLNYLFEITNGFKDFSVFLKVGKTKAVDKLSRMLSSFNSSDTFEDEIEKFFK